MATVCLFYGCSHTRTISTGDGTVSLKTDGKGKEESLHITGKDGATVDINSGKKITDYPADIPFYQGTAVMDVKDGQNHGRTTIIKTDDSMDKISAYYKGELDGKGWKVETTMSTAQMTLFSASKGDQKLVIQIGTDGKEQSISQTMANK